MFQIGKTYIHKQEIFHLILKKIETMGFYSVILFYLYFSNITDTGLGCALMFYHRPMKEGTSIFRFHFIYCMSISAPQCFNFSFLYSQLPSFKEDLDLSKSGNCKWIHTRADYHRCSGGRQKIRL